MSRLTQLLATAMLALLAAAAAAQPAPREIKVLVISMFEPEAAPWIEPFALRESVPVPGLLADIRRCAAMPTASACWWPAWATPTRRRRRWP